MPLRLIILACRKIPVKWLLYFFGVSVVVEVLGHGSGGRYEH